MRRRILHAALFAASALCVVYIAGCKDKQPAAVPGGGGEIGSRFTQDVRMYEQALATDPNNFQALVKLGNIYYDWGVEEVNTKGQAAQPAPKWLKGIEYYGRALEVDPSSVDVRVDMGNLLRWTGQTDEAMREYSQAKLLDPKHPQARINLVLMLGQIKGDYKAAVREYDELIKVAPEQAANTGLKEEVDGFRKLAAGGGK